MSYKLTTYTMKKLPYPMEYKDLIGKRGENPYIPVEFLGHIGTKQDQLKYIQALWKEHFVGPCKGFTLKTIT